eukprot:6211501-Pleurochrysis_carterae.AAC.2
MQGKADRKRSISSPAVDAESKSKLVAIVCTDGPASTICAPLACVQRRAALALLLNAMLCCTNAALLVRSAVADVTGDVRTAGYRRQSTSRGNHKGTRKELNIRDVFIDCSTLRLVGSDVACAVQASSFVLDEMATVVGSIAARVDVGDEEGQGACRGLQSVAARRHVRTHYRTETMGTGAGTVKTKGTTPSFGKVKGPNKLIAKKTLAARDGRSKSALSEGKSSARPATNQPNVDSQRRESVAPATFRCNRKRMLLLIRVALHHVHPKQVRSTPILVESLLPVALHAHQPSTLIAFKRPFWSSLSVSWE